MALRGSSYNWWYATRTIMVLAIVAFASAWNAQPTVASSNSLSIAELQEAIAGLEARIAALVPLEARVAALEGKLRHYEAQEAREPREPNTTRPLLVSLTENDVERAPMRVAPLALSAPKQEPKSWSGLYWGTSFGYGGTKSSSRYDYQQRSQDTDSSVRSSRSRDDEGSVESDLDLSSSSFEQIDTATGRSQGSDWNSGALADLYLGTTFHLGPRILAGVQLEGSLGEMAFESKISREKGTSKDSSASRFSSTDSDGNSFQSSNSDTESGKSTNEFDERNKLELDWMVSVIGRAGWLATPTTFLYGLGGWTYGHFDGEDLMFQAGLDQISDFGSHGVTVGGGLEKKLTPKWSLRAEYRYTHFGKESFSTRARFNDSRSESGSGSSSDRDTFDDESSSSSSSETETSSSTNNSTYSSKGYFDNEMHVGRIGVTRYFTLGD